MICPVCKIHFTPAGFGMHAKKHVARGELVRVEKIRAESGKATTYVFNAPGIYAKPKRAK